MFQVKDINSILSVFNKAQPGRDLLSIYDGNDKYLLFTAPKSMRNGDINTDPYYICTKTNKQIIPFDPLREIKWYKNAKTNLVWEK